MAFPHLTLSSSTSPEHTEKSRSNFEMSFFNTWRANDSHSYSPQVRRSAERGTAGERHRPPIGEELFILIRYQIVEKIVHIYRKNEQKYLILSVPAP